MTGSGAVLLLGCGAMFFAIVNVMGSILMNDPNTATTIYNTGACLAGLCYLGSAYLAYTQKPGLKEPGGPPGRLGFAYTCVLITMGLLILGALARVTPAFFISGQGSTLLREAVLDVTVIEFVLASIGLYLLYRSSRTPFLEWYSLGLMLIGLGIGTLSLSNSIWTPLTWVARGGQYLGGLYLLIGIWSIAESGGNWRIPLEKALQESEEKYRTIVETASEGIWISDTDGRTTFINKRIAEMLGYSSGEMLGKSAYDFMDEEAKAIGWRNLEQRRQGFKEHFEQKYIRKDGTTLWAIVSATPLQDKDGRVIAFMGMLTDITEQKRNEEVLRGNEARRKVAEAVDIERRRLFDVLETLSTMVCLLTPDYHVAFANRSFREKFGESQGRHCYEYCFGHTEPCEFCESYIVLKTGQPHHWELNGPDGSVIEAHDYPFTDVDGTPMILEMDIDITVRKRAEAALRNLNETLERLVVERTADLKKAKQQAELYLDLMGHDINNLHQIALGYLELARDMPAGDEQAIYLDKPVEVLQRSAQLIQNVRKLQKLHEGVFQTQNIDVSRVLMDVQQEFGAVPNKQVRLNVNGHGPCFVRANELLHDVFANLVGNAIKHTGNRTDINVGLDVVNDNGTRYCRVVVEDDGPGIPDGFKTVIFNRTLTGTHKGRGMGLGLYLVKSLVDSYGGRVWVEDRIDGDHMKGARFVVILPVVE
jgi:PAS domain S-box-containing protein